ncbi:PEP-CTERM sorting domain-containing protein [Cyanobacterium sp. Dongsha4]|uniref:PEP-CTERM sorting domain-containing protein n=1 Tax=Cyanobacterium sp. DS4 TaxID=2878255 RepID=UPI002E8075C2|nr:PEP-CTERM sorting domain-containing protein [Cyanobacterium sp. Dongsha4]WVK99895.1 LpqN/LpqT family lipoprotein [Cyanobacterium sp. Dongsha4]
MNKLLSFSLVPFAATTTVISVIMTSAPAKAISFNFGGTQVDKSLGYWTTSVSGTTVNTFDSSLISGIYNNGGIITSGTTPGQYATPANNTSNYFSVGPSTSTPATIKQRNGRPAWNYFGLYWGSIDGYNSIEFYNNGRLLQSFTGSDIIASANGNQTASNTNRYVNFFSDNSFGFNEIRLSSTSNAFESDNHAFREVPEPLTILGTGLALGLGGLFKSKQSKKQSVEA